MNETLTAFMKQQQEAIHQALESYLAEVDMDVPSQLKDSMAYSLLASGKKIRPIFVLAVIDALNQKTEKGLNAACAIEMIHTYSLIHDDLPAMDDDDYRRGKQTNHKIYGEATAILAGDAMLTHAFYVLLHPSNIEVAPHTQVKMARELSLFSGAQGMVGGQMADLLGEGKPLTLEELSYIHKHKTGDLLVCAVRLGAYIGEATDQQLEALTSYARHIGLAFQIQDDILDEIGDEQKLGKQVGSDRRQEKSTYVTFYGLQGAQQVLNHHIQEAKKALTQAEVKEDMLLQLADFMVKREH